MSDLLFRYNNEVLSRYEPLNLVKRGIPDTVPMKITEILPRLKDGGAFVKFEHSPGVSEKEIEGVFSKITSRSSG